MATFTYEPYSIIGKSVGEHHGSELMSAVQFALKYNMTPVPVINEKDYWGDIFPNWSGNGLLGNLVDDKADVGFSALYTWEFCYHFLELSKPLVRTGITCLVPAPKLSERWLTPLFSYSSYLWFCIILTLVIAIFVLSLVLFCYNHNKTLNLNYPLKRKTTYIHFLESAVTIVLKPVFQQSLTLRELPIEIASKLLMGLVLLLALFLTSSYGSGLATVMTIPTYENAINTVEDFANSGLDWGATQDAWIMSIQNAEEQRYVKIVSKFHPISEEELFQFSKSGKFGFSIERLPFEDYAIGDYIKEDVIDNFHLMKEDLYWEQCVIMLRKNSVLLPALDLFILKIFEAGLISHWQNEAVDLYMNPKVQRAVKEGHNKSFRPLLILFGFCTIVVYTTMKCYVKMFHVVYVVLVLLAYSSPISGEPQLTYTGLTGTLQKRATLCPRNTECLPLSQCPMLNDILDNACVNTDRIANLGCGYQGAQGYVCCPLVADPLNNINSGKLVDGQRCGLSQVQGNNYNGIGAFPWVARVGFRNVLNGEIKYPCTGSIINNRVILTAAHCALAKADSYKLSSVRVGEWNSDSEIDCGEEFCGLPAQDVLISHVIVHPGYDKQTYRNNIALLVLRNKINYTVTAQPICLPETWSVTNRNGILVGWGRNAKQNTPSNFQQTLYLPITDLSLCHNVYGRTLPISEHQLCAGGEAGNDACSGFGGAPLMVRHGETHYQVGILSFGSDQCGAAGVPSVYTNVKKYISWIRENIPVIYNN
ncbi:Serine protease easter-like Protein [Tribolium castaneum]|uniref:Serine protease easter-like Protein n=1 Tax=Tribolium castaneum TaxID=7070 RepID=A0A139WEJ1_TRICA|nr:Serine protease easter-like Protein [Tribolium castaneum]